MLQRIHFIFSGTQNFIGGGTTAWKNLLANLNAKDYTIVLHYSSFAKKIWEGFQYSYITHVVHHDWKTYDNKKRKYYDDSYKNFRFDAIEDGAKVVFDASECVRQLTDKLAKKGCSIFWHVQSPEHYLRKNVYRMYREIVSMKKIKKFIFISSYIKNVFENDPLYRMLKHKISAATVSYGIPQNNKKIKSLHNYVIYFGRYEHYKHPLFLEKIVKEVRYIGTREGCTHPIEIPKHKDMGWKPPSEAAKYGDFFVFPSISEAFGLAVIEMMSYGKIPICFNSGAFSEIIKHNENGFLIEPFDYSYANQIIEDLFDDDVLKDKIADNAFNSARNYNIENYQTNFFREILNED